MQRRHREQRRDRGAVRHRDDARRSLERLGIDLRDRQRHVGVHAEGAGVVDAHRAVRSRLGDERSRHGTPGADERHIDPAQEVQRQLAHLVRLASEGHGGARGPRGGERQQLVDGEATLLEGADHLPADGPGGTDDSDLHDAFQPNSGPRARSVNRWRCRARIRWHRGRTVRGSSEPPARRRPCGSRTRCGSARSRSSRC